MPTGSSANTMDEIDEGGVITALSTGKEYEDLLKGDKADSGSVEGRVQNHSPRVS